MEVGSGRTNQESSSSTRNESSVCEECQSKIPIYQCPGCLVRTCSLYCCRGHKNRTGCSGKRQRSTFVPVSRMTDSTMRSDYFFLEEVLEQIPRNGKRARTQELSSSQTKDKKSRRLVQQAERRGITLQIMPPMMIRHKSNSSWYSGPRDTITWKVEVVVHPSKATTSFNLSENEENIMDHILRNCEKKDIEISPDGYLLFIMRLPAPSKNPRYIEIGPSDSLKTVLRGMTIVEHPTIYCVPNDIRDEFPMGSEMVVEVPKDDEAGCAG
jgi:hypothetical protein